MKRILSLVLLGILALVTAAVPGDAKVKGIEKQKQEVMEVLKKFQAGYTARDVSKLNDYVNELFDPENVLIIGTSSYGPKKGEWCDDIKAVKDILTIDWKYWDDLILKVEDARVMIHENTAWVVMWGTSESKREKKEIYDWAVDAITKKIEQSKDDKTEERTRKIMFWVAQHSIRWLLEYEKGGEKIVYPIRISAVLTKKKNKKWMFRQMDFAFPTQTVPDVRLD